MLGKLRIGYQVWRHFGIGWVGFRLRYALRQRTGALKRKLPITAWCQQPLAAFLTDSALGDPEAYCQYRRTQAPPFFFAPTDRASYSTFLKQWDDEANSP